MKTNKPPAPALQLWTIRDAMILDADLALSRVKSAGFSSVEIAPLSAGLTPERMAATLDHHALNVVSIHGDLPTSTNIEQWKYLTRLYRSTKIIWHGWPRDPRYDSLAGVHNLIAEYHAAGTIAQDHGFQLGLHNHWWEFESVDGTQPFRLFQEYLHPEIFWQLDIYWAQTAGVDPVQALRQLGPRLGSVHWKDGPAIHGQPNTALGKGHVEIPRILHALTHPVDWVIELDECATDPMEAARESRQYLDTQVYGKLQPG